MSKGRSKYDVPDEEHNLLDVECHSKDENENPGTVTVEGFGMECWDYEIVHGPRRDRTYIVTHSPLTDVPAKKVLRRIDELRRGATKFGWNPDQEELDLQEFFGLFAMQSVASRGGPQMYDFYSLANRDLFIDYATGSSIALEWNGSNASESAIWNILWQVILGKEMAMRLQNSYNGATNGFTNKIHTTLIVQDLWLQNVELVIMDQNLLLGDLKKPETREEVKRAEKFHDAAKKALKKKKYQEAADLYTEAMRIDLSKPAYRSGRAAALLPLKKSAEAEEDAWICKELDPSNPEYWSQLGTAQLQRDKAKKAKVSFQRALDIAGKKATKDMRKDLEEATKQVTNQLNAIEKENNKTTRDRLRKDYLDQDWDLFMGKFEFHSTVHQRQVEGLLLFAQKMKWPYINETRDHAEGIYQDLRAGKTVPIHLYDWIFGLTLPGKWMSFKIMSALIIATPSVYAIASTAAYFDCGLVIPRQSYWRLRTVLGRVLGALPGVTSLCGWIGPCPAVEFDPPLQDPSKDLPRNIHLSARPVAPLEFKSDTQETIMGPDNKHDRRTATRIKEGEDEMSYLLEVKDKSKWFAPASPVRDLTTVTVAAVRLKKLPLDSSIAAELANKSISEEEARNSEKYRASIAFTFDNNTTTVPYTLYTNPVFVTPPACYPPPGGTHHIHEREKHLFDLPVWTVDQLKNHAPDDDEGGVMVINATGKGAEVVARAWCAERGKCAIVRKAKGPCYVCAVTAASRGHGGLGFGVLIWAS